MMRQVAVLLCLTAGLALGDADELVRRAQVRLEHDNIEGARALLERALAEAPSHGPALDLLALADPERAHVHRLRYLEHGRPLDPALAREALRWVAQSVWRVETQTCHEIEREGLTAIGDDDEACGPWRRWEPPARLAPAVPPAGPLRGEAFGSPREIVCGALHRIAARFERERLGDAVCWARLALALHQAGDDDAARAALAHSDARTLDERVTCALGALGVSEDPYRWWQAHGDALLAELVEGGPSNGDADRDEMFDLASRVLFRQRDVVGLARLEAAAFVVAPLAEERPLRFWGEGLATVARPDEVYDAIRDQRGRGMACLRAQLLFEMKQEDLAVDELKRAVQEDPGDLLAWSLLFLQGTKEDTALKLCASEALVEAVIANGCPCWPGLVGQHVRLLRSYGRSDDARRVLRRALRSPCIGDQFQSLCYELDLLDGCNEAIDEWATALRSLTPTHDWGATSIASAAFANGRPELALEALDRFQREPVDPSLARTETLQCEGTNLRGVLARLRTFATHRRLTNRQDAALRGSYRRFQPGFNVPPLLYRARVELETDAEFRSLPGAGYVLSLTHDDRIQPDAPRRLRREAYDAGFRSRGLLIELLADGLDVLDELAAFDPVLARLESAIRSGEAAPLEAFLEEDAAWPAERELAMHVLRCRNGRWPVEEAAAPPLPSEEARARWVLLQTDPPKSIGALLGSRAAFENQVRLSREPKREPWPPDPSEPPVDVEDLVRRLDEQAGMDDESGRKALLATRQGGKEALHRLFAGVRGFEVARWLLNRGRLADGETSLDAVRRQRALHPLDLRWVELEQTARWEWRMAPDQSLADVLWGARSKSPATILRELHKTGDAAGADAVLARYLAARSADLPRNVLESLAPFLRLTEAPWVPRRVVEAMRGLCANDADEHFLVFHVQQAGLEDVAEEIDARLLRSDRPSLRYQAIGRDRVKRKGPRAPAETARLARDPSWSDAQACGMWGWVLNDAAAAGREDLVLEALQSIWDRGLEAQLIRIGSQACTPESQWSFEKREVFEILSPRLGDPRSPPWLLQYGCYFAAWNQESEAAARAEQVAFEAGFGTVYIWGKHLARTPAKACLDEMQRLVGSARPGRAAYDLRIDLLGPVNALRAADRKGDVVSCLEAWAERCGPLTREEQAASYRRRQYRDRLSGPFELRCCFEDCLLPIEAALGLELHGIGLTEEALDRLVRARKETPSQRVRQECLRAEAAMGIALSLPESDLRGIERHMESPRPFPAEQARWALVAAEALIALLEGPGAGELRTAASDALSEIWDRYPGARGPFVDSLLREHATDPFAAESEVEAWVARLGASDAAAREEAEAGLRAMGGLALPLLRALRASPDPEVRSRAEVLLENLAAP